MGSEWRKASFAQLCDIKRGASPRPIQDWVASTGIPWVKISDANASRGRFITETRECIKVAGRSKSVTVYPGDLILSNSATPGIPKFLGIEACIHDGWLLLRNFRGLDKQFAYYLLLTQREALIGRGNGSVFTNLKTEILKNHEVTIPPLGEQHRIAEFLGWIDERLELIHSTNTTLEAIAQALFKSWFVDFDPVHAKADGREPEAMDVATAALFPSEFQESELGPIPRGWSVKRLSDLVELAYGKALKANDRVPGEIPVYGSGGLTGWHNVALVKEPTIIIGRKGSVGTIYWEDRPCHPIDTVFFVRSPKAPLTLCLQVLRSLGLDKMNTDAAVPGLNRENAYRLEVVAAPTAVNDAWQKIAEPIYDAISNNSRRCEVLSQLRDTMLTRLISGKLHLPETAEIVIVEERKTAASAN